MVAAPCAPWHCLRGPVRNGGRGRPFNGIVRQHSTSVAIVRTSPFFDGTWWEATCPEGWKFRQDKSVKGYPYVFETESGYRLQLGWGRDSRINFGTRISRPDIDSEPLRIAYVVTLKQAQLAAGHSIPGFLWATLRGIRYRASEVQRHSYAGISGFTYPTKSGWAGTFVAAPWYLDASFARAHSPAQDMDREAFRILESLRFLKSESAV
jgi:hypothetical protein